MSNLHNLSTNFNPPRLSLTYKKSYKTCVTLYHLLRTETENNIICWKNEWEELKLKKIQI